MIESCYLLVGSWLINNHSSFIEVMVEKTYWRYRWTKTRCIWRWQWRLCSEYFLPCFFIQWHAIEVYTRLIASLVTAAGGFLTSPDLTYVDYPVTKVAMHTRLKDRDSGGLFIKMNRWVRISKRCTSKRVSCEVELTEVSLCLWIVDSLHGPISVHAIIHVGVARPKSFRPGSKPAWPQ